MGREQRGEQQQAEGEAAFRTAAGADLVDPFVSAGQELVSESP